MDRIVVARLSGEITLKSPGITNFWLSLLLKHIKSRLYRKGFKVSAEIKASRVYIEPREGDPNDIAEETRFVFGIKEALVAIKTDLSIDAIIDAAITVAKQQDGKSFAVRTRRVFKEFPLNSLQISEKVGSAILEALPHLKVDLSEPDFIINIEIRKDFALVYERSYSGFGGLPYSISGKAVALVSGGIDSSVASWLGMKRGLKIVVVHGNLGPYYSDLAKQRFLDVFHWLSDWVPSGHLKGYIIPAFKLHDAVELPANRYRCVFCKMMLLRVAEIIARREQAHAIITGESLSQVASQTLSNMRVISLATDLPIFRPLIFMDKTEIDHLAQRIGLYPIVSRDVGECGLLPRRPAVETELDVAEKILSALNKLPVRDVVNEAEVIRT